MNTIATFNAATLHLSDDEFLAAFESCTLPGALFHHADHIRLARLYVLQRGPAAPDAAATAIRRYAAHLGAAQKYHETITRFWMVLVAAALAGDSTSTFVDFAAGNPQLFDKDVLNNYYSRAALASPIARETWLAPDLAALP